MYKGDKGFDERWKNHPDPQPNSEQTFWEKTGWEPEDLKDKVVLDAGCGCGRFTQIVAQHAKHVICIDSSAEAIKATIRNNPTADVREDDLLDIQTVAPESVDMAFSIGVLDHTGDTRKALEELAATIKPGGKLAVWVYPKPVTDDRILAAVDMLYDITRSIEPEKLYEIIKKHACKVRDSYRTIGEWGPLQQVVGVSWSDDDDECISDTFDWYCPQHRDWHTEFQVKNWFTENGLQIDRVGDQAVNVCGTKISTPQAVIDSKRVTVEPTPKSKPRVLLVSDVRNWAFDRNAKDMERYLKEEFDFEHAYIEDWKRSEDTVPNMDRFDVIYLAFHLWGVEHLLPLERTLGSLKSGFFFPEDRRPFDQREFDIVRQYRAFTVVTRQAEEWLQPIASEVPIVYLTNPLDMTRHPKMTDLGDRVVPSWNGNARHSNASGEDAKGFYTIIQKAVEQIGLWMNVAEYWTSRVPADEMPEWYLQSNISLCACAYDGASNALMEGMASGHALIAPDVGPYREMQESELAEYGDTGIMIIERNIEAMVEALQELRYDPDRVKEMGRINRAEMARAWSWDTWAEKYADFLRIPLSKK